MKVTRTQFKINFRLSRFRIPLIWLSLGVASLALTACGEEKKKEAKETPVEQEPTTGPTKPESTAPTEKPVPANNGLGVGPIKSKLNITGPADKALAAKGKTVFEAKCTACHNVTDKEKVGPGLKGVTDRHQPEWIMNMILAPDVMVKEDPVAKALLEEHLSQMANQNLTKDEARAVVEYFRQNDGK